MVIPVSSKGATAASTDVVVISDSGMFARGVPSMCYGLRGLVYFQIDLRGSNTDLHSGSFGGAVANPAFSQTTLLSPTALSTRAASSARSGCLRFTVLTVPE